MQERLLRKFEQKKEEGQVFTFDNETHIKKMLEIKQKLGL